MAGACARLLALITILAIGSDRVRAQDENGHFLPMDKSLVALNSSEGRKLLSECKAQEAFWNLAQFYSPQADLGSCSVASCTMVLNALPIERPVSKQHQPYKLFTPDNLFTPAVEEILKTTKLSGREKVSGNGMTLAQLSRVLGTYPVKVDCVYGSESNVDKVRKAVSDSLAGSDSYVVVNYLRKSLNQESGGHISPLGAYNKEADMVLILDTANYKYPWTWVKTDDLWKAMAGTVDSESKRSRGYVIVSGKSKE